MAFDINKLVKEYYRRYKFLDLSFDSFSSLLILDCNNLDNETECRETFENAIYNYSAKLINNGLETVISLFKKATKILNSNDLFNYLDVLSKKYNVKITDDDINYICDFQYLHKFYDESLSRNDVDDIIESNSILGKVLDLYSIAVEDDKYYVEDVFVNDSFKLFMKDLSRIPVITPDRENELFKRYAAGEDVKNEIIEGNLRLVIKVARHYNQKYQSRNIQLQDLIQDGYIGLKNAVEKFDLTKGFKFSTYAVWWIKQAISRDLEVNSKTITIPSYKATRIKTLQRAMIKLEISALDRVNTEELSKYTGFSPEEIEELFALSADVVSLDKNISGDDEEKDTIINFVSDEKTNGLNFSNESHEIDKKKDLYDAINMFDYKTATVMKLRYGLGGNKELSLVEIGKMFNVSRERIRQIEKNGLETLQIMLRKYSEDYGSKPLFENIRFDLTNDEGKSVDLHKSFAHFSNFMEKINESHTSFTVIEFNPFEYSVTVKCNNCENVFKTTPAQLTKVNYKCEACSNRNKIKKYQEILDKANSNLELLTFKKTNVDAEFRCKECGARWKAKISYILTRPYCGVCHNKDKQRTRNIDENSKGGK